MTHPTRRTLLAGTAGTALLPRLASAQVTTGQGAAAAPLRGGALRVSVDQAASVLNPLLTRVNPEYLASELL